jgi:secondary thiamine-phosphate synthase enzyme
MRQFVHRLAVQTRGRGFHEITNEVADWAQAQGLREGLLTLFCRHTSASLLIQENAAPEVRRDFEAFWSRIAPQGQGLYAHEDEGPDDMPAHLRASLTQSNLSIPLIEERLVLGTWQGVYVLEHRARPHRREIALHLIGA